jgi:NAD(P)-dependent dehydrogenase (short-subunit alcohol dehydrogenase family)
MSRNILITGANGALGLAIAEYFLTKEADCRVFLGVRERRDRAEELVTRFLGRADLITLEITSPEAWKTALTEIEAKAGALGVLINNAGFHEDALLANMSQDQWSRVLDANLNAVFHGCQAVLPDLQGAGFGKALVTASLTAIDPRAPLPQVMIGDADYYGRFFGFSAANTAGWKLPGPWEPARLLCRTANPAVLPQEGMLGPWRG